MRAHAYDDPPADSGADERDGRQAAAERPDLAQACGRGATDDAGGRALRRRAWAWRPGRGGRGVHARGRPAHALRDSVESGITAVPTFVFEGPGWPVPGAAGTADTMLRVLRDRQPRSWRPPPS